MSVGYVLSGKIAKLERELEDLRAESEKLVKALEIIDKSTTGKVGPSRGFIRAVARPALEDWKEYNESD